MKILVTGFEPFGGETVNPAWEAVCAFPDEIGGAQILRLRLPVTFDGCLPPLIEAVQRERPDAVLCVGQAGGRAAITPERVAINLDDARIPDNAGQQPTDQPIEPDGPAAFFTTLPVKAMVPSFPMCPM